MKMTSKLMEINSSLLAINNSTLTDKKTNHFHWSDILLTCLFVIVLMIGVMGNALVCYCFNNKKNKKLATMECLIYWLAIVDLCASIINPALFIYWQVTFGKSWHFGVVGCKLLPTLAKVTVSISFGLILIITIDRCITICWPFNPAIKQQNINVAIVIVIFLSILSEMPNFIYLEPVSGYTCTVANTQDPNYAYPNITIYMLRDLFFLSVFCLTTVLIYAELLDKEHIRTLKQHKDLRKTKQVVNMIVTMAVVFVLLVFPRDILHISFMISWLNPPGIPNSKQVRDINAALKFLHMCNSVSNVFIYAGLHARFRVKIIRLFKSLYRRDDDQKAHLKTQSDTDTEETNTEIPILMDRVRFETLRETNM